MQKLGEEITEQLAHATQYKDIVENLVQQGKVAIVNGELKVFDRSLLNDNQVQQYPQNFR